MATLNRNETVTLSASRTRILAALAGSREPVPASALASRIWPGHRMKPQGAGFAAVAVLRPLIKEGLVVWRCDHNDVRGYILTSSGRDASKLSGDARRPAP